ncbi:P-loop containing nucleoside triphosphate hydrolase protein [Daldinia loculata]|uniref:P-loop containing nucleoside triphosphate hydrolase protein n=1 Tax=Daldinia loculata TaxID=103429 RepID=UPI0020C254EE|nr:P-loop containing nucleoside triphosphate hydrolase protein [Daldinia loculata]KAI1648677.1 P-loop containing nucleoside triphosphate hydrolase protein [Daldinia loculata]
MDHSSLEYKLARVEERIKTLEKIVVISTETQAAIWKHVPSELDKSRDIIFQLLEGSQNITIPSQTQSLTRYVDSPQGSVETSRDVQSFIQTSYGVQSSIETSYGIESSNNTSHSIESFNQARQKAEIEEMKAELLEKTEEMKAEFHEKTEEMKAKLLEKTEEYNRVRNLLEDERKKSRVLVGTLRDIQGNIRVLCRIRPPGKDTPAEDLVDFGPQENGEFSLHWGKMTIPTTRTNYKGDTIQDTPKTYDFERIFGSSDTNEDVFEHISDLVESSMEGQRIIMFAYGQTGAGKTFTLSHKGPDVRQNGVIPRSLDLLFETKQKLAEDFDYTISVSIQEIYQNRSHDLLGAVEAKKREGEVRLNSVRKQQLHSREEAMSVIDAALEYRVVSTTDMNAASSRSHLILSFEILRRSRGNVREVKAGVLNIVDLAGSERPNAMGLTDNLRKEGIKINKSLMSLTRLINCIATGEPVVYDTELVRALRPALSHQTKVVMFVMISPLKKDQDVSFQTLERGREASAAKMASADLSGKPAAGGTSSSKGTSSTRGDSPSRGGSSKRGDSPSRGGSSTRGNTTPRGTLSSRGSQGRGRK